MKTTCNEVRVNSSRQKALINHFIRELFGNEGLRADVKKYSPEEYLRVLQEFTAFKSNSLQDSIENIDKTFPHEQEVLLSFLKHYALQMLSDSKVVSIKDHLANHLAITSMLRLAFHDHPEQLFSND